MRWESRTPTKGELVSFEATTNLLTDELMRLEPSQNIGWRVAITDANGLGDLSELRVELGNDERLGMKYTTVDNTCASLDERLLLLPSGCTVETNEGVLTVEFTATVQWSLTMAGIAQGDVDVIITDYDGTQRESFSERWVLEREMTIEVNQLSGQHRGRAAKHRDGRRCHGRRRPEPHGHRDPPDQCDAVHWRPPASMGRIASR